MAWIILAVVAAIAGALLLKGVRVVPAAKRAVIERLGRPLAVKGPGLIVLVPFFDRMTLVDFEPTQVAVPGHQAVSHDNQTVTFGATVTIRVLDPLKALRSVADHRNAIAQIAKTAIDAAVGRHTLDETLDAPAMIAEEARAAIDEPVAAWGIKLVKIELTGLSGGTSLRPSTKSGLIG